MPKEKTLGLDRKKLEYARVELGIDKSTIAHRMQIAHPDEFPGEPPRKLVTRAFSELNILHSNAMYVAEALETPLANLAQDGQLASPSSQSPDGVSDDAPVRGQRRLHVGVAIVAAIGLLIALGMYARQRPAELDDGVEADGLNQLADVSAMANAAPSYRFALLTSDTLPGPVRNVVEKSFGSNSTDELTFVTGLGRLPDTEMVNVPQVIGTERVAGIDAVAADRHIVLTVTLASDTETVRVWTESVPAAELSGVAEGFVERSIAAVGEHLGLPTKDAPSGVGSAIRSAFDDYHAARLAIESSGGASKSDLDSAFRYVQSAIDADDNFALAYAAKCEVLTRLYWVDDSQSFLDNAEDACVDAEARLPGHPYVVAVRALKETKAGRYDNALETVLPALELYPQSVDLRMVAAEAYFAQRGSGDREQLVQLALAQLRDAISLEPDYWAPHFWMGTYSFYAGQLESATKHLQDAADRNPNELVLANLGTISLCIGDLDTAERTYSSIIRSFPTNHLGPETLASVYHFQKRYEEEIGLRLTALKLLGASDTPQIHQMYGNLGDANRQLDRQTPALEHYGEALDVLRRDKVKDVLDASDHAAMAYYTARIADMTGRLADGPVRQQVVEYLSLAEPSSLDIAAHTYSARAHALLGHTQQASEAWDAAIGTCAVYSRHPDR